jgi:hypothetical protein
MNLIDLLLKNAHIIILVAIGLFTMWTKARKQQRQTGTGMPSFGGPTTAGAGERREKRPSTSAGSNAIRSEQEQQRTASASAASSGAVMSSGRPGAAAAKAARSSEGGSSDGGLTLDNAAQGVIWAEVLGPPRAKNPYRPR